MDLISPSVSLSAGAGGGFGGSGGVVGWGAGVVAVGAGSVVGTADVVGAGCGSGLVAGGGGSPPQAANRDATMKVSTILRMPWFLTFPSRLPRTAARWKASSARGAERGPAGTFTTSRDAVFPDESQHRRPHLLARRERDIFVSGMATELATLGFSTRTAFEKWLSAHHATSAGLWLRIAKAGAGVESVTYVEALDVALCYGWIDGQKGAIDAQYWRQRFTPRRPSSKWSKINCAKAEALIAAGRGVGLGRGLPSIFARTSAASAAS